MLKTEKKKMRRAKGFTLLEMMLVVVIIGLLVGVAVINLAGQGTQARTTATKHTLSTTQNAILLYFNNNGSYPATLQALVPTQMPSIKKDAWKNDLIYYLTPSDPAGHAYALFSMGPDGTASTADDINVWNMD